MTAISSATFQLVHHLAQLRYQVQTSDPNAARTAGMFAALMLFMFIAIGIGLAISVLICFLLYNAQKAIPPEFRKIEPGMIWLLMIPLFGFIWNFFVYMPIADSYRAYFNSMGRDVGDAGRGIGLAFCICVVCVFIPCLNYLAGPASLVLLIIFLVKIYGLKGQIGNPGGGIPMQPPPPPIQ